MQEELFGVGLNLAQNYGGRDQYGQVKRSIAGQGVLMTRECAEKLCAILRHEFPQARIVRLYRGDRDEISAQTLEELGERAGLDKLALVVHQCLNQGFSAEEIAAKCRDTIDLAAAQFAKEIRIRELEAETMRLKAL
jgi:hypothetical protein